MKSLVLCDDGKPEKIIRLCEKYRFGIEIQGFYNPNETEKVDELITYYKDILPENIDKYFHAPFWDLCLGSANLKIAEITRYYFDYSYNVAQQLGCLGIIIHHGFVPNTSHPPNWIKRSVIFWQDFFRAHPGKMNMYMENQCEQNTDTLIGIVDKYSDSRLRINLDIGHAHCNNDLPVQEWIKQLNSRIGYVHIHQNNGMYDEHLGLDKGNIPIIDVLNLLNEHAPDAVWALECNTDDMELSVEFLLENEFVK